VTVATVVAVIFVTRTAHREMRKAALIDEFSKGPAAFVPVVTTRGHFADGKLKDLHTDDDYAVQGEIPGWSPAVPAPRDLIIVIHGLNNSEEKALYKFGIAAEALRKNGYTGGIIGFSWDGDTSKDPLGATGYRTAKKHAIGNGKKLARFLSDYHARNPGTHIRLIGYSMGARVALEAIFELAENPAYANPKWKISSVHLVGAAVDNEEVQLDERYGKAIEARVGTFFNYYSREDDKLGQFYWINEADRALGETDIENRRKKPANYVSREVERELPEVTPEGEIVPEGELGDNHSGYLGTRDAAGRLTDDGVMDVVARDIRRSG
jgi:pimeloyl-ACP methyl ester carboxylesterase